MGNFIVQDKWKTKKKMGECHSEGHFTDPSNKRVEETTHKTENNGDVFRGRPGPRRGCIAIDKRIDGFKCSGNFAGRKCYERF
jgi:hypothetical protein